MFSISNISYRNFRNRINPWLSYLALCGLFIIPIEAQSTGQALFNKNCTVCHTIGSGRLVGPDLAGVQERRTKEWLHRFIPSSQTMIKSGNSDAAALFKEYNQLIMPDFNLTATDIDAILQYINSASDTATSRPTATVQIPATVETIQQGQMLFSGKSKFTNNGPVCISCHHISYGSQLAGGTLARDLTQAVTRLTSAGVLRIIQNPPFPAMTQAYKNRPLTDVEALMLTSFLQQVDRSSRFQPFTDYTLAMLATGLAVSIMIFLLLGLLWKKTNVDR